MGRRNGTPSLCASCLFGSPHCRRHQNSILPWKAIMRGEVSPPRPTPSSPVGGEVVLCSVPNLAMGEPGTPACTVLGSAKLGWLNALNIWPSMRSLIPSRIGKVLVMYMSEYVKCGPRTEFRPELPNWQIVGLSFCMPRLPVKHAPVVGSTTEMKVSGFSHCFVPATVTPG